MSMVDQRLLQTQLDAMQTMRMLLVQKAIMVMSPEVLLFVRLGACSGD